MQIGNPGDPGLTSLLSGKEGGDRIVPPAWKGRLTVGSARANPADNIRAGVGYLLMRMANFRMDTVVDPNARIEKVTVTASNNNLWHIARNTGTTVKNLQSLNPGITPAQLKPGMELKYQKASEWRVIFGCKNISLSSIAQLYNTSDVVSHSRKLDYVRNLLVRNNFPIWMKIILGLSLATCLSTIARADDASTTPTEKELYDECSEFSMAGIHDCLRKKRDESQKVLAQAEARMNTVMSRWDVDDQFIATAKSNFIKDKQEFLKYREVHCNFMRSLGGPVIGIGLDARLYTCVAELNYRRAKLLEDVFPDLPSK